MKELIYNNLQRWIPPSDVDGVDLKPEIASTARNIIFQNGFFKNAVDTVNKVLPSNIQAVIDLNYQLIGYTNFNHSTQGFHEIYILFSYSEYRLYICLDNEHLIIGEDTSIVCITTPNHINFSLVNDQLKINLNCKGVLLEEEVLLNLSLVWLDEVAYIPLTSGNNIQFVGVGQNDLSVEGNDTSGSSHVYTVEIITTFASPDTLKWKIDNGAWSIFPFRCSTTLVQLTNGVFIKFGAVDGHTVGDQWLITSNVESGKVRAEGWYLAPRWLGWQLTDNISIYNQLSIVSDITEDFEDSTYISGFIKGNDWARSATSNFDTGLYALKADSAINPGRLGVNKFTNLRNLKKIVIEQRLEGDCNYTVRLVRKDGTQKVLLQVNRLPGESSSPETIEIEVDELALETFEIWVSGEVKRYETNVEWNSTIEFNTIQLIASESMVIAKYFDSQRAFLTSGNASNEKFGISLYGSTEMLQLRLDETFIDWRVTDYELYVKNVNGLYTLRSVVSINENDWTENAGILTGILVFKDEDDAVETLNFNYGLGEGVRVDTQHPIYNEASFNNRVYAVNGGYRILQTHIAGNGRIQPDSFPYSEDDFLGFIEEAKSSLIQSLFIINNNFLMIYMTNGYSLYQINSSPYTGRLQKELRMLASSFTGFNPKSLTRMINATSPTIGAYWVTNEGIWYHDGSLGSVPINLITDTHRNYWKTVEKTNFGFYDYQDNEYWYATKVYNESNDDHEGREFTEFIIYEINFKTFRFVRLEKAYYELAGYIDGKPLLRTNTAIGTLNKSNNKSLNGLIETHWNDLGNEYYNKIAQAISIQLKQSYADGVIYLKAQFDDQTIVYSFEVSTNEKEIIRMFPESVRFKSVKLSVLLYNLNLSEISASSFKLVYTEDGIGRFGEFFDHQVIVEGGGYGKAYGRYYGGSNPAGAGGGFGTQYGKHYGN